MNTFLIWILYLIVRFIHVNVYRVGYNMLESLPEDMFDGNLGRSIRFFSCPENNLLEIPMSIRHCSPLGNERVDCPLSNTAGLINFPNVRRST